MSKLESLTGRALEIVGTVGDSLKDNVPDRAMKWLETGAALGMLKAGGKTATKFARRNPAVSVALAAGTGLLLYAAHRQKKKAETAVIEGSSTRIDPASNSTSRKRATGTKRAASKRTSTRRSAVASTDS